MEKRRKRILLVDDEANVRNVFSDVMNLGERIRKLRKGLGLTQKEFAGRVVGKVDYTYIGRMERDQQYPSIKMLQKIGKAFSVPLSYFFTHDDFLDSSFKL